MIRWTTQVMPISQDEFSFEFNDVEVDLPGKSLSYTLHTSKNALPIYVETSESDEKYNPAGELEGVACSKAAVLVRGRDNTVIWVKNTATQELIEWGPVIYETGASRRIQIP